MEGWNRLVLLTARAARRERWVEPVPGMRKEEEEADEVVAEVEAVGAEAVVEELAVAGVVDVEAEFGEPGRPRPEDTSCALRIVAIVVAAPPTGPTGTGPCGDRALDEPAATAGVVEGEGEPAAATCHWREDRHLPPMPGEPSARLCEKWNTRGLRWRRTWET